MQHHPGAWYMPWGVPLQKINQIAFPFHPTVAAVGYHQTQPTQVATGPPPPNTHQQQQHTPQTHHQTYQQHQMHPATALHQQLHHPAAAAAMFTPLLRTFIPETLTDMQCPRTFMGNRNHVNLNQPALTNVASLVGGQHQQPALQATQQQTQISAATRHHQGSPIQGNAHHQSHSAATIQSQTNNNHHTIQTHTNQSQIGAINLNMGCVSLRQPSVGNMSNNGAMMIPVQKVCIHVHSLSISIEMINDRFVSSRTLMQIHLLRQSI